VTDDAMPAFFTDVEIAERERARATVEARAVQEVKRHLARSGGRLACPHPVHRFATVPGSPAEIILPECAGRPAWLAARLGGIGGSEVGALIGVNEHETTWSIWKKKTSDLPDEELTGAPIEWGHRLEDVVAQKTAEEIGLVSRFAGGLWADRERPFIRVTPDRLATKPRAWKAVGVIECKTAGDDEHWESGTIRPNGHGTGRAPLSYQAQLQWQLGILGLPIGWLGCYVSNMARDFFTVEVHFDKEWFREMTDAAERFWVESVLGDKIPEHNLKHPITEGLLKEQHPDVIRPSVQLGEDAEEWLRMYEEAKAAADEANAELDSVKNWFRLMTADAGAAYLGTDKVVGYPVVNTTRLDVEALRKEEPELAERFTVKSTHRRLSIKVPRRLKS
jgi:putative phage-type endonuclease